MRYRYVTLVLLLALGRFAHAQEAKTPPPCAALELDGVAADGGMVLTSAATDNPRNRITWRVLPDARVRQLWETSSDGGATWTTSFDGYYEKKR